MSATDDDISQIDTPALLISRPVMENNIRSMQEFADKLSMPGNHANQSKDDLPTISIIVPVRNEERYLNYCLDSIAKQTYPHELIEVLIVDGRSEDSTREIAKEFAARADISVHILENSSGNTPCGLNIGYKNANGDIFIHFIGHATMPQDFIEKNVNNIKEMSADAVGGLIISSCLEDKVIPKGIGYALNSPFGLGGVTARTGTKPGYIDNPSFAAYKRELFDKYGYIDERLTRNQDYEFNQRITSQGAKIFFTPEIKSFYFNRPDYGSLWREYLNAAKWRTFMVGRFTHALRKRHFVPPLFILTLVTLGILSYFVSWTFLGFLSILSLYLLFALGSSVLVGFKTGLKYIPAIFLSYLVIHIAYGLGFICGFLYFIVLRRGKQVYLAEAQ